MPRKMVRSSGPFSTWAFGLESTREISWIGTGSMMSTSPDSRAATRVASEPIGVKMISFRLCSGFCHQFGFGLNTLGRVGFDQHLVSDRVQLLVAIAAEIGLTARGLRIIAATHDVGENIVRVGRPRRPAQ